MAHDEKLSMADVRAVLTRALPAILVGDTDTIVLFTEDVIGRSSDLWVRSR